MAEHSRYHSSRRTSSESSDAKRTQRDRKTVSERQTGRKSYTAKKGEKARSTEYSRNHTAVRSRTVKRETDSSYREPRNRESLRATAERNSENRRISVKGTAKGKKRRKFFSRLFSVRNGLDMPFFLLIVILLIIGVAMMFSASYAYAYYNNDGNSYYYLIRQAGFAVAGIVLMLLVSVFDYRYLYKLDKVGLIIAFLLLVIVLFMPPRNGVTRWIEVGELFSFQASEIMKFALILFYARWGYDHFEQMGTFKWGVLPAIVVAVPTVILLILEPHYSCIVIIVALLAVMMFISGVKMRWFAFGGAGIVAIYFLLQVTDRLQYAQERLDGWGMALDENLSSEMQWKVWQTMNSLYAIGSGGLTGLGLGQSREKYLYLPEPQNDFVFAIVMEELGLIGGLIILLIFIGLIIRGIHISLKAHDKFGMLLGVGLVSQIGIQVLINILVITDTLPNTGISLPFFSYGGTSLCMLLAEMGVVLSISRNANIEKT